MQSIPPDVIELESAITRISHMLTRSKQHEWTVTASGVEVDRAAVPLLRALADAADPVRLGELAARLNVEAPHVTRQVQRLERAGYVERVPDPCDRRAQQVRLTVQGLEAVEAIRSVGRRWMQEALATWTTEDRERLAALFHRMVDDFLDHGQRNGTLGPAEQWPFRKRHQNS